MALALTKLTIKFKNISKVIRDGTFLKKQSKTSDLGGVNTVLRKGFIGLVPLIE